MIIKGKFTEAKVFASILEDTAKTQIQEIVDCKYFEDSEIAIMPDAHQGKGAVIGFTARMNDWIVPNIVGGDIGCSVIASDLGEVEVISKVSELGIITPTSFITDEWAELRLSDIDKVIRKVVPMGFNIHEKTLVDTHDCNIDTVVDLINKSKSKNTIDPSRVIRSLGTLGGGNHFIELNVDERNHLWLVVHTGSRNFGLQVATHYQTLANSKKYNKGFGDLAALPIDGLGQEYIQAMRVAQNYAKTNRHLIVKSILEALRLTAIETVDTTHNYLNLKDRIIRKGAVSSYSNQKMIIPFNMRDGSVIAVGKNNSEWNYSAPHGAGRVMSRTYAKKHIALADFQESMEGVFSTSVSEKTLDEAPMTYKDHQTVLNEAEATMSVLHKLVPIYSLKSSVWYDNEYSKKARDAAKKLEKANK